MHRALARVRTAAGLLRRDRILARSLGGLPGFVGGHDIGVDLFLFIGNVGGFDLGDLVGAEEFLRDGLEINLGRRDICFLPGLFSTYRQQQLEL